MNPPSRLMAEELARLCKLHNIPLEPEIVERARSHFELLLKWNRKISLTAIVDPIAAARQHYFEAIYASQFILSGLSTAADVGSGGGFPGLPISFVRPDLQFNLIEADRRKAAFLAEARRQLGLANIQVINERFEKIADQFDLVLTRAIEQFEAQFPALLDLSSDSRQAIFFLSELTAKRLLESPDNSSALSAWQSKIVPLPESRERAILLLQRLPAVSRET